MGVDAGLVDFQGVAAAVSAVVVPAEDGSYDPAIKKSMVVFFREGTSYD